ncbi:hypothetical protein CIPAW_16G044800 [Carya illinoinensis]|uniref:EF-hand domain-containing protein n=1 Tax=Carya illinoinensis TaxID=32201 RepID=A0A8T1N3E3_CARIL|nr:hypothetical protein CIPAW_16G044800 [Carya illinoinensis]KAG6672143.1 hypothetical protein I3842_16G043400 [Carya illinoinensis]
MNRTKSLSPDCNREEVIRRPYETYNEAELRHIFRLSDVNRDGVLSRQELRNAFYSLGSYVSGWRAYWAIFHADADKDGYISEAELDNVVRYAFQFGYTVN